MIIRDMFDTRVKICKVCQGHVDKKMVIRDDYKGHLFYCVDCGTEYKIVGEGQAENELEVEYERNERFDWISGADVGEKPAIIKLGEPTEGKKEDEA